MANLLLFHHAQGLTEGMLAFADELRAAGHNVTQPDLYEGHTFSTLDEGLTYAKSVGFGALAEAGVAAAEGLPDELVYGGFSLGVMPAQQLAQQRPNARGVLLYHGAAPLAEFGEAWPDGVAFQAHVKQDDLLGDVDVLEELAVKRAANSLLSQYASPKLWTLVQDFSCYSASVPLTFAFDLTKVRSL